MPVRWMTSARALSLGAILSLVAAACEPDPIGTEEPPVSTCEHSACGTGCCGAEQRCAFDECVSLDTPCFSSEDCGTDEICIVRERSCVSRSEFAQCRYVPPTGEFRPEVECSFRPRGGDPFLRYSDVVMAPSVANLTDDDGDGRTGPGDVPDMAFIAFDMGADGCCTNRGVLRIVSGSCEAGRLPELATIANDPVTGERFPFDNSAGIAIADLDPRGSADEAVPEIVVILRTETSGETMALRRVTDDGREWSVMWRNRTYPTFRHFQGANVQHGGPQPSVADVDSDGRPEVIVGNIVLNGQTGELIWDGLETVGPDAGIGNNGILGPISVVADIDLDGHNELIAGDTIYDAATGRLIARLGWNSTGGSCPGMGVRCDGFVGIADFDGDRSAEIVSVRSGQVALFDTYGYRRAIVSLPGGMRNNEGGPPTIADFDGDGRLEVGVAGASFYTVVDFDCEGTPLPDYCHSPLIRWAHPIQDISSRATGSSVFDFEGDGRAEVVYADERTFFIFDGATGEALYRDTSHTSTTRLELPVVVDLDADGQAEVIVARAGGAAGPMSGIDVFGDAGRNWVRTRRIWNQHAYFIGNVMEFGIVPTYPVQSFTDPTRNAFRQNIYPGNVHDAPDLVISGLRATSCGPGTDADIEFYVENMGIAWVGAGVRVRVRIRPDGDAAFDLPSVYTTRQLDPGESQQITVPFDSATRAPLGFQVDVTVDWEPDDDGRGRYNECDESNNTATARAYDRCIGPG
jgi:hypothetical protein